LRGNAAEADRTRRLPQANIDALADAGIFKIWIPKRYGGYEADPRTYVEVLAELSRADASTSWAVSLITAMSFMLGQFPEAARTRSTVPTPTPASAAC